MESIGGGGFDASVESKKAVEKCRILEKLLRDVESE
jgi:hypothetical protein